MTALDQLKKFSTVVADTADFNLLQQYGPEDATTNPTLVLASANQPQYAALVKEAAEFAKKKGGSEAEMLSLAMDKCSVNFGNEILKHIKGRVSTEVDARLSFDTQKSVEKARQLISMYEASGTPRNRIYIKLASTWDGVEAAKILEKEGICCNLTLLFSFAQALICAEAGVSLISPFVGRIFDWYKKFEGKDSYPAAEDPGVLSVIRIFQYYALHKYKTTVMGASFRNVGEVIELAGCDKLTISPKFLDELAHLPADKVVQRLSRDSMTKDKLRNSQDAEKYTPLTRETFSFMHNEDPMAVEKLAEGIRNFSKDAKTLEGMLLKLIKGQ